MRGCYVLLSVGLSLVIACQSSSVDSESGIRKRGVPLVYLQPFSGYDYTPKGGYDYTPKGYDYTPKGYVYPKPTTTTTPEPEIEQDVEANADEVTPEPPVPVEPEKEIEASPDVVEEDPWDIRDSVPGSPGENYPVYGQIPKTSFSCEGKTPGFYADPETRCQVFHRCGEGSDIRASMDSFLCSNGTQFNQEVLSCDWWENVKCEEASKYYSLNKELHSVGPDGYYVKFSGMRRADSSNKPVSPGIIPKSERKPLPSIYRSHKHHNPYFPEDNPAPATKAPQPTKSPVIFSEFKPAYADESINNALNNPDYFNPEPKDDESQKLKSDDSKTNDVDPSLISDDDYFANSEPLIDTRIGFRKEIRTQSKEISEASKLDNDPLQPSSSNKSNTTTTTTTTHRPTTRASSTTSTTTTTPEKSEPLIGFRASFTNKNENDNASGFIVNRVQSDLFNQENNDEPSNTNSLVDIDREIQPPSVSSEFGTNYDQNRQPTNGDEYLPPKNEYLPPTTTLAPVYLPPTQPTYLPPKEEDTYKPIADSYYRKPSKGYGLPLAPVITYIEPPKPVAVPIVKYLQPPQIPVVNYVNHQPISSPILYNSFASPQYSVVQPASIVYSQHASASAGFPFGFTSKRSGSSDIEIAPAQLVSYKHSTQFKSQDPVLGNSRPLSTFPAGSTIYSNPANLFNHFLQK